MGRKTKDITGQVFGRLTALEPTDKRSGGNVVWKCRCSCDGKIVEIPSTRLVSGITHSCGCINKKDITGQVFGRLTALEPTDRRSGTSIIWKCRCSCGEIAEVTAHGLVAGDTRSCGCLKKGRPAKDLTGQVFGRLTALEPTDKRSGSSVVWKCRCSCDGKIVEISASHLVKGLIKSCGCLKREIGAAKSRDLSGQVFGKLTALEPTDRRTKDRSVVWRCQCSCDGKIVEIPSSSLVAGLSKSCGCLLEKALYQYRSENFIANTNLTAIKIPETTLGKRNTSGVKGVFWCKKGQNWIAAIGFMKKAYSYHTKSFNEAVEKRLQMRAARDEFLDWWNSLTPEEQKEAAGSDDIMFYQRQQFEKRINIILEK